MTTPLIRTRDVAVELGGRPVLRGIDLSVSPGEVVAILGANGSGKSTLVRTLLGLVPPVRGDVELFGTRLDRFRAWERVGFVPQRATATSGVPATVREVVAAGRLSRRTPFLPLRRADRDAITAAVEAVGLGGRLGDGVSTLSGGQQQRVLIARALAGEPELLVLDEPTAGVDVQSQQAFADALGGLVDRGATDRPGRPRARAAGRPRRARGRDARRSAGVRRPAAGGVHRRRPRPPSPRRRAARHRPPAPRRGTAGPAHPGREQMSILAYDFVVRALLGALFTGLAAPAVGTYLVQRRLALMGDGIGHVAVTGVALGLLTGAAPLLTAVVVAILGAVAIEAIRGRGRTSGDVALALLFYGGIAGGVMITGLAGESAAVLQRYLFGSISTISAGEVWMTVALAAVVLLVAVGLSPQLFGVAQDEEFARVSGLRVRAYNLLIAVMAAVTVTVAMRTVGLLLVSALDGGPGRDRPAGDPRVPDHAGRGDGAGHAGLARRGAGVGVRLGGARGDHRAAGAGGFVAAYPVGVWLRHRQHARMPFDEPVGDLVAGDGHTAVPEDHEHRHGPDCGHRAVPHGDHVDYVHDGHRHAVHGSHYDEH